MFFNSSLRQVLFFELYSYLPRDAFIFKIRISNFKLKKKKKNYMPNLKPSGSEAGPADVDVEISEIETTLQQEADALGISEVMKNLFTAMRKSAEQITALQQEGALVVFIKKHDRLQLNELHLTKSIQAMHALLQAIIDKYLEAALQVKVLVSHRLETLLERINRVFMHGHGDSLSGCAYGAVDRGKDGWLLSQVHSLSTIYANPLLQVGPQPSVSEWLRDIEGDLGVVFGGGVQRKLLGGIAYLFNNPNECIESEVNKHRPYPKPDKYPEKDSTKIMRNPGSVGRMFIGIYFNKFVRLSGMPVLGICNGYDGQRITWQRLLFGIIAKVSPVFALLLELHVGQNCGEKGLCLSPKTGCCVFDHNPRNDGTYQRVVELSEKLKTIVEHDTTISDENITELQRACAGFYNVSLEDMLGVSSEGDTKIRLTALLEAARELAKWAKQSDNPAVTERTMADSRGLATAKVNGEFLREIIALIKTGDLDAVTNSVNGIKALPRLSVDTAFPSAVSVAPVAGPA